MFKPPKTHQLWKKNDYRAQKKGIRNTIYSINGDEYTGEWLNNMKHGKLIIIIFKFIYIIYNVSY